MRKCICVCVCICTCVRVCMHVCVCMCVHTNVLYCRSMGPRYQRDDQTPTPPSKDGRKRVKLLLIPPPPIFAESSSEADFERAPANFLNLSDDTADEAPMVHPCLRVPDKGFTPCCLIESTPWCGSTLRMQECFRGNLVGTASPKTQTLRPEWCAATINLHRRIFEKNMWFRVNCGGQGNIKTIGWGRYIAADRVQLGRLTARDCAREGRPEMNVDSFLAHFLLRGPIAHKDAYVRKSGVVVPARVAKPAITPATFAWRFQYEFIPCVQAPSGQREAPFESSQALADDTADDPLDDNSGDQSKDTSWNLELGLTTSDESDQSRPPPATQLDQSRPAPATPPSFAAGFVTPTSVNKCRSNTNKTRREKYAEKILYESAMASGRDDHLVQALSTATGRRLMPLCAQAYGQQAHFKLLADNTKLLLKNMGGRHKKQVAHLLTGGLPNAFCRKALQMSHAQIKRAKEEIDIEDMNESGRSIEDASYATDVNRDKIGEALDKVLTAFFNGTTHQCSGADQSKARIMDVDYFQWDAELSGQWPGLLRELAAKHPHLVPDLQDMPKTGWTDFEACLLSAVHASPNDPKEEREVRTKKRNTEYNTILAQKKGSLPPTTETERAKARAQRRQRVSSRLKYDTFDPAAYDIRAPAMRTFRAWLKRKGLRYTRFTVPHPCPLCTDGPTNEVVYAALSKQIDDLVTADLPVPGELTKRCNKLRTALRVYRIHLLQLEASRAAAKKAEDNLVPGEAMVIRDFVNHHDHSGKHVKCLHWVLMWRDEVGEPLKRLKLRHYCSDKKSMSTDSYFQADVTEFHLNEDNEHCPKLFKDFKRIIFVGDHGPHFASHETMHNESTLSRKYGKEIKLMFLASYHAYSRADGSGAEDSTALRRDLRAGMPRVGATDMTEMTNASNDSCSWAYEFPNINRGKGVFPKNKAFTHKDRAKWIKKWCEVRFIHPDESGSYDGVLQYRLVTGEGVWNWTDLVANERGPEDTMCDRCSTKADEVVYHKQADCPSPSYIHDLPVFRDLQPDPTRISGEQMPQGKSNQKKKKAAVKFPCKYTACVHHLQPRRAFRSAAAANRHMRINHEATDADFEALAYPDKGDAEPNAPVVNKPKHAPVKQRGRPKKKALEEEKKAADAGEADSDGDADESEESDEKEDGDWDEDNSGDSGKDDEDADSQDNSNADSEDDDQDDPEEVVNRQDDEYEVEAIANHKLLASGKYKYHIAWVGTPIKTWEIQGNVNKKLREEYHEEVGRKEVERKKEEEAAKIARGCTRRRRRGDNKESAAAETARLEELTKGYQKEGLSFWRASDKAKKKMSLQ